MTGILWAVLQDSPIAVPARYCCGVPHHITLQYGVERDNWNQLIGLPMIAGVIGEAWNDRIQAIEVILPTWATCQTPHPHISISWVQDAAPIEANVMLANDHQSALLEFDRIHTIIEWVEWGEPTPLQCPNCKSDRLVKFGKTRWGRQRWKCKTCSKTM